MSEVGKMLFLKFLMMHFPDQLPCIESLGLRNPLLRPPPVFIGKPAATLFQIT
jgi:hypothetical protein